MDLLKHSTRTLSIIGLLHVYGSLPTEYSDDVFFFFQKGHVYVLSVVVVVWLHVFLHSYVHSSVRRSWEICGKVLLLKIRRIKRQVHNIIIIACMWRSKNNLYYLLLNQVFYNWTRSKKNRIKSRILVIINCCFVINDGIILIELIFDMDYRKHICKYNNKNLFTVFYIQL